MSESGIWDNLHHYPEPADIERLLLDSPIAERFKYTLTNALYKSAESGDYNKYTLVASEVFKAAPDIHLVPQVMRVVSAALSGAQDKVEVRMRQSCQRIAADIIARVRGWSDRKHREVVLHYSLKIAALVNNVGIAEQILREKQMMGFLEHPIYAATRNANDSMLALLLFSLGVEGQNHIEDVRHIAEIIEAKLANTLVHAHLHVQRVSIIVQAMEINELNQKDPAVKILLLPLYIEFIGDDTVSEKLDATRPFHNAFHDTALRVYAAWKLDDCLKLGSSKGLPTLLMKSLRHRIERDPFIQWDAVAKQWTFAGPESS
ncbi:hypothetical protein BDW59DRAFT_157301 [Aspergillus cavernicola]|uniref:Uncharacterized protein n=1 Tax=Aspergillus cavernicola TaxID=176166 RepID=A0ABR4IXH5_9EURO